MEIQFVIKDPSFAKILGEQPISELLAEAPSDSPLFHEACVYDDASQKVFVTSNQFVRNANENKCIRLSEIHVAEGKTVTVKDVTPDQLADSFLNGGVNYGNSILMCVQGSLNHSQPAGLYSVSTTDTNSVQQIVSNFHGIPFNSVNDVVVHPVDGSIWFTDPCYGHHQGIRPSPQLPNQVYRYDPSTKAMRAVADGFTRPNGICFSPDLQTVYITDTGAAHGSADVAVDFTGPSHIYAFTVVDSFLVNRRLFAYAPGRFPDGIKCDTTGNVYSGCGDGVNVWDTNGTMLGVIKVPGGVANFCFGRNGAMYLCNETRFWKVQLTGQNVRGALLGI